MTVGERLFLHEEVLLLVLRDVEGTVEFEVTEPSPGRAFSEASLVAAQARASGFTIPVYAATLPRSQVTAHVIGGRVRIDPPAGWGETIRAGQVTSFGPAAGGTGVVLVGARPLLLPSSSGFFTDAERAMLDGLLAKTDGDRGRLLEIIRAPGEDGLEERCMAIWLLGEMGNPEAAFALKGILDADPRAPTPMRSAAVSALARLATSRLPWEYCRDPEPAVAEAALLSCARAAEGN